jgi:hypothetical protein
MFDSRTTLPYPIDLPARLRVGESDLCARIRNLSLGGVSVMGATGLQTQDPVTSVNKLASEPR